MMFQAEWRAVFCEYPSLDILKKKKSKMKMKKQKKKEKLAKQQKLKAELIQNILK